MNLLLPLIHLLILLKTGYPQFVTLTLCFDETCSSNCITNTEYAGSCFPCKLYHCKVGVDSLTFYKDNACASVEPAAKDMALFMDSGCKTLYGSYDTKIGSYKASNLSAIIGGTFGGVIFFVGFYGLVFCLYSNIRRREKVTNLTVGPNVELPKVNKLRLVKNPFYCESQGQDPYYQRTTKPNAVVLDIGNRPTFDEL